MEVVLGQQSPRMEAGAAESQYSAPSRGGGILKTHLGCLSKGPGPWVVSALFFPAVVGGCSEGPDLMVFRSWVRYPQASRVLLCLSAQPTKAHGPPAMGALACRASVQEEGCTAQPHSAFPALLGATQSLRGPSNILQVHCDQSCPRLRVALFYS